MDQEEGCEGKEQTRLFWFSPMQTMHTHICVQCIYPSIHARTHLQAISRLVLVRDHDDGHLLVSTAHQILSLSASFNACSYQQIGGARWKDMKQATLTHTRAQNKAKTRRQNLEKRACGIVPHLDVVGSAIAEALWRHRC